MGSNDQRKTKAQLMAELAELRERLSRAERLSSETEAIQCSLREAEEKYHNLINNVPVGLFRNTPGPTGRFIMANPAIARMFGYESVEHFLTCSVAELYQDPEERKNFSDRLLAEGKVVGVELRLKRLDGSTLWGSVSAQAMRDGSGEIVYFDGLIEDITKRKQAEQAIQESEEQFRVLFQSSRDAIMILDKNGFIDCNRSTLELFGCSSKGEFVSKHPSEVSPALQPDGSDSLVSAQQRIQAAFEQGSQFFRWIHKRMDGTLFPAEVLLSRYSLRGEELLQAVVRDITEREQAEKALRESEEQFRTLFERSRDALMVTNREGFIDCNSATLMLFGYSNREDFLAKGRRGISPPRQPDGEESITAARKHIEKAFQEGSDFFEWVHQRVDGSVFQANVLLSRFELGGKEVLQATVRDISESKRMEEELKDSQRRLADIIDFLPDATFVIDKEGKVTAWNRAIAEMSGLKAEDILGHGDYEYALPFYGEKRPVLIDLVFKPIEEVRERYKNVRREGDILYGEGYAPLLKEGGLWFAASAAPLRDSEGQIVGAIEIYHDVTLQKRMVEELKESQRRLSDVIDFLPDATMVIDAEGRVTAWNRAIEAMTGVKAQDILGKGDYEYAIPFYGERRPILIDLVLKPVEEIKSKYIHLHSHGETLTGQGHITNLGGGDLDFVGNARVLRDSAGNILGAIETIQDVTERNRYEKALRHSEERLRTITDTAKDAIIMMDDSGSISFWNPAAKAIFGHTAEETIGQNLHDLLAPERYRGDYVPGLAEFWKTGKGAAVGQTLELEALRKDGTEFPIEISLSAIKILERWHAVAVIRDISDRKRTERELQKSKEEAETANQAKSAFLAMMSHEIRTPMNAIIGMTEILADTELSDDQRSYTDIVMSSAGALLNIINDILDFSKIEAGKMDLSLQPFDFRKLVEELGQIFALKIDQKKIDLVINYEPGVPQNLIGDEVRLRQILTNLVGNASKFTHEGHILIEVTCKNKDEKNAALLVRVEDTGIGIPAVAQATIFDTFTQVDSSSRRRFEGTGLGLAITRQLINLMNGEIGFESELGKGSNFYFTVTLPLGEAVKQDTSFTANLSGLRVLVVDDNKVNRVVLRKQLASCDMEVDESAYPQNALLMMEAAAQVDRPYDIAILDFQMPQMDGIQLAEAIRADGRLDHTILIMLFSAMQQSNIEHLERLGLAACMTKPVRTMFLLETISKIWAARIKGRKLKMITSYHPSFDYYRVGAAVESAPCSAHVLLAEDNIANQKVAGKLLEKLGATVEVASDGQEAVKLALAQDFDLIFMDCQMPEMDGFEATRKIREAEAGKRHTPIIALTAYAMQGDREICLAAGMDDYVTKPISKHRIQQVLGQYLKARQDLTQEKVKKLLIADRDDETQKMVYTGMRKIFPGAIIKTSYDGIRTVALLASFLPDLLVLDLSLPDVSWPAVIKYMREDERFSKTRVIAMANLEKSDPGVLQEILILGIGGMIYKPLQPDRLEEMIRQFLKVEPREREGRPETAACSTGDETWPTIDDGQLENITGGDPAFVADIMGFYKESLPKDVSKIQEAIKAGDIVRVEKSAHGVKGGAANLGAARLSKLAARIEIAAREKKMEECRKLADKLPGLLSELIEEMEKRSAPS